MLRFIESVLDNESFYSLVYAELHDKKGITVYSDEPLGSNYSCFDYNHEGNDKAPNAEYDQRHVWEDCKLTMNGDGTYWKSASGKNAALNNYAIKKAELKPGYIKLWIAPTDSSDQMAVLEFWKP